jgi:hypothetical protein
MNEATEITEGLRPKMKPLDYEPTATVSENNKNNGQTIIKNPNKIRSNPNQTPIISQ